MSLEEMINEDFYKNLFRLLNSPKPDASAELKKIIDNILAMYKERGITEYWPTLPGDTFQVAGEGAADAPTSTRKFEKPIAPTRKDSLAIERLSPHAAALRSNSPRHSTVSTESSTTVPTKGSTSTDNHGLDDTGDSSLLAGSIDADDSPSSSLPSTPRPSNIGSSSEAAKRKGSNEVSEDQSNTKIKLERIVKTEDIEFHGDEPPMKKPKIVLEPPDDESAKLSRETAEAGVTGDDLANLVCVVCKKFNVSAGNWMVECNDCHKMYHQKCHQPNVPLSQIDDPRLMWCCYQCEKKKQRSTESPLGTGKTAASATSSGRRHTSTAGTREEKKQSASGQASNGGKRNSISEAKEKSTVSSGTSWSSSPAKPSTADLISKAATFLEKHKKKVTPTPPIKPGNSSNNTNPFAMALSSAASSTGVAKSAPTTTSGGLSKLAVQQPQSSTVTTAKTSATATSATIPIGQSGSSVKQLPTASSQMQAAEKRLQMMKKRAAMKGSYKI